MKIIMIIDNLGIGGAQQSVVTLSQAFSSRGLDVTIVSVENHIQITVPETVHLHCLTEKKEITGVRLVDRFFLALRLKKYLKRINVTEADMVVTNLYHAHAVTALAGIDNAYYVVRSTMSLNISVRKGLHLRCMLATRRLARMYRNKHIIAISNGVKNDLLSNLKITPKTIHTIYNPFNFEKIRQLSLAPCLAIPNVTYILAVASYKRQKRLDVLLWAYAKSNIRQKLVILGGGSREKKKDLENLAKQLNIKDRVHFAGWEYNPYPWIRHADLLVLSSETEAFGRVIVEALALGVPVVSTDVPFGGPKEILTGKLSACLAPINDCDRLASTIQDVLKNPPGPPSNHLTQFSASIICDAYLDLKSNVSRAWKRTITPEPHYLDDCVC